MKWSRKVLIVLCVLAVLAVLLNFGLNIWIDRQLPKVINRENDSEYYITYKDIHISLWDSDIIARKVVVVPKGALRDSLDKAGIYAEIESVKVSDFKIGDILFNDKIKARSITIEKPTVILYKRKARYDAKEAVVAPFEKVVSVRDIYLKGGNISIVSGRNNTPVLSAKNIDIEVDGLLITETILAEKIPFHCQNYRLSCDSLDYFPNHDYQIRTQKIRATKTDLSIAGFEMLPLVSRRQFTAKIDKERDLYTLRCKSVRAQKIDWGFKKDDFYFHGRLLKFDEVAANIYRSKEPADDLKKKPLYNKLLRELEFDLRIDTLKVRNSIVEYEEEKSAEFGAGKVSFSRFNAAITGINSGFKRTELPDVKIAVNCLFMKNSPLSVNWRFNPMDKSDGFQISGKLRNFDAAAMAPFTKPYVNVTTQGTIEQVNFNFIGNDLKSRGNFAVEYDDLKFTIYQKDEREKKNKFLTFVSRIFVKKTTKDRLKSTDIEIERIPEKSFYNFLWRSVGEGLKQVLI